MSRTKTAQDERRVFSDAELAVRRMRTTGMRNRKQRDDVALALADFQYAMARLGAASEGLAREFNRVALAKARVEELGAETDASVAS